MLNKTITISCPVRDRQSVLPYYLEHIYNLDYPKHLINLLWVVNQSTDNSEKILKKFKSEHHQEYGDIKIINHFGNEKVPKDERVTHIRNTYTYSHLSALRNLILKESQKTDYLLSVDSDILIPPDSLNKLLSHDKDICAGIIWNGYLTDPEHPWRYPNILKKVEKNSYEHIANTYVKLSPKITESRLGKISATGAFVLMSNKVVKNTSYGWHPQGEDLYWSLECEKNNYELWCDYSVFGIHVMHEELLHN